MRTRKIYIKNLFGIKETELDGSSVEITGKNGTGKTSVIDAIRYALTNDSDRDYIVRNGENEGEILIETDTGLSINRKKRVQQADYKSIKENGQAIQKPESFLNKLFTPIQLNPVEFAGLPKQEQNRIILDLIEFDWDLNWIKEQFGEIPEGVNYEQNILQVLEQIQADDGVYFQRRQDLNREIRNNKAFIEDIAKDLPDHYDAECWKNYDLGGKYQHIAKIKDENNKIQRAKAFIDSYNNKIRAYEAEKEISISAEEKAIASEREGLLSSIERMKAEIKAAEEKCNSLNSKLEDKKRIVEAEYDTKVAKLDGDMQIAKKYSDRETIDISQLEAEVDNAAKMIKHLNEYDRMIDMQKRNEKLKKMSEELTDKIELARFLPGEILKDAVLPVENLTVKDGIPLINGLPVSNLSDGEKLDLCVDIAISKPNALQIILIDGAEKLSDENRAHLYKKCKDKGLQFIATRTTNENELEVTVL